MTQLVNLPPKSEPSRPVVYIAGGLLLLGAVAAGMAGDPALAAKVSAKVTPPTPAAELAPIAPMPFAPMPVAPMPVAPMPVAPMPVAPMPVAPMPVAPMPVAPMPFAPMPAMTPVATPVWYGAAARGPAPNLIVTGGLGNGVGNRAVAGCPNRAPGSFGYAQPAALVAPAPVNPVNPAPSPAVAPPIQALPFQEAHWQGLELLPYTRTLAKLLDLPPDAKGVIVDEATMPSDEAGFLAGDMVMAVGGIPTPDLMSFIMATSEVRSQPSVQVDIYRKQQRKQLVLTGLFGRVGTANGETAQTIPPGSRPPHAYQGACTNCHRIGTQGQLPTDQGDLLIKTAPSIRAGQVAPHEARGTCSACHTIGAATGTGAVQ